MLIAPILIPRYIASPAFRLPATLGKETHIDAIVDQESPAAACERARGLGILTHAMEYLIDSRRLFDVFPRAAAADAATQILLRLSRRIFQDGEEIVLPSQRLYRWISSKLDVAIN